MGTVISEQRNGPGKLEMLGIWLVIFQQEPEPRLSKACKNGCVSRHRYKRRPAGHDLGADL